MTGPRRATAKLVRIEAGEGAAVVWSFAYFFFLLSSYYVIRPLRDEMGIAGGESALTWLYMGTLAGTLVANPILGALVSRYPRRVFVPVVYRFLTLTLVAFYVLLSTVQGGDRLYVARVFFVWASVFNLFAVSVFWGFMADLWASEQGKRLFGFLGLGGTLGAVVGAASTAVLAPLVGPTQLLLLAALLLEAAVFCTRRLGGVAARRATEAGTPAAPDAPPGRGVWNGIRLVATSPYLLGICLFLFFYTISSTLLYFEQARIVRANLTDPAQRTAFFARMDLYVNLLTIVCQLFLSSRVLSRIGIGATLSILPTVTLLGFAALAASPVPSILVLFQVIRRGCEYAFVRPAREVLFTVVSREEKYTSKNLIDTFVYRGGDAIGALVDRGLALAGLGAAGIALVFAPVAATWIALAALLGRAQAKRVSGEPLPPAPYAGAAARPPTP